MATKLTKPKLELLKDFAERWAVRDDATGRVWKTSPQGFTSRVNITVLQSLMSGGFVEVNPIVGAFRPPGAPSSCGWVDSSTFAPLESFLVCMRGEPDWAHLPPSGTPTPPTKDETA